jgi:hypothetical protein
MQQCTKFLALMSMVWYSIVLIHLSCRQSILRHALISTSACGVAGREGIASCHGSVHDIQKKLYEMVVQELQCWKANVKCASCR